MKYLLLLVFFTFSLFTQKNIVIICASYKNAKWYKQNLDSMLNQKYENYHIIYIDDNSPDNTGQLVAQYLEDHPKKHKITLIQNESRKGALYNQYHTIHTCFDDTIIIICDGDDWFAHQHVLTKVSKVYENNDVWLTYGQYKTFPKNQKGLCAAIPMHIINSNNFRNYRFVQSHLRTFYAGLFKKIKKEDLYYKGSFYSVAPDFPVMLYMMEMARDHFMFIPEVLYIYNRSNPLNEFKINKQLILEVEKHVRSAKPYDKIASPF